MAFSLEFIRTSEQRAELLTLGLLSPITKKPAESNRWVVDRARGMYFVNLGGGAAEMPWFLALVVKDVGVLRAEGRERTVGEYRAKGVEVWWELTSVVLPKGMADRDPELRQALEDALVAYGALGRPEVTKAVHISMVPTRLI